MLDDIDFTIEKGTVFSLLGPNGAGKTTAVRIFSTLLQPDGGQVRLAGPAAATRRNSTSGGRVHASPRA